MLKKAISIAITMGICLGSAAVADEPQSPTRRERQPSFSSDEQHFGKDSSVSVGVKMWASEWELPILWTGGNNETVRTHHSEERENTLIPTLNFKCKNFFILGSYFPETNYSFDKQTVAVFNSENSTDIPYGAEINADRSEWDINFGYYLLQSLVITAGYKRIKRDFQVDVTKKEQPVDFFIGGSTETDGLTIGIAGVAPLRGKMGLYGSFAFGWLKTDKKVSYSSSSSSFDYDDNPIFGEEGYFDVDYYLGELGFVYSSQFDKVPVLNAASLYLGYRFQVLNEEREFSEVTDNTSGFVLGVNLAF
jgi:hypothetical protein